MGNKKWQSEAESYLRQILDVLEMYEEVVSIEQHSNKVECFEIFKKAYEAGFCALRYRMDRATNRLVPCKSQRPVISRDMIWNYAKGLGWVHSGDDESDENERRYEIIQTVMCWWNEWVYAWDRAPLRRRYKRRASQSAAKKVRIP